MTDFLQRHRNKLVVAFAVLAFAAMLWTESRRGAGPPTGEAPPPFDLARLDSADRVSDAALRGRPAVIDFFETWCAPCVRSLPKLDALAGRYAGRVDFYAVNSGDEADADLRALRDRLRLRMPILTGGASTAQRWNVETLPTTVLLDADGRVTRTFTGAVPPDTLERALEKLLRPRAD